MLSGNMISGSRIGDQSFPVVPSLLSSDCFSGGMNIAFPTNVLLPPSVSQGKKRTIAGTTFVKSRKPITVYAKISEIVAIRNRQFLPVPLTRRRIL